MVFTASPNDKSHQPWSLGEALLSATQRQTAERARVRARVLLVWAKVEVPRLLTDTALGHLPIVESAVIARAEAALGGTALFIRESGYPFYSNCDVRARMLALRLDLRFGEHQRLVAAVLAAETHMEQGKALRVVRSGRWWMNPRWRRVIR